MKFFFLIAFSLVFALAAFRPATAQVAAVAPGKIGLIDTRAFLDDKAGIKKYIAAIDSVNNEFKAAAAEMDGMAVRLQTLEKELKAFQDQSRAGAQINQVTVNAKLEEYDKLSRQYKFKREDNEAKYNRRQFVVVEPVQRDISTALQEFTKKNGFWLILDVSKLQQGAILGMDERANITRDFIAFYNARPATSAVTK